MDQQYIFPAEKLHQLRKYDGELTQLSVGRRAEEPEMPAWMEEWLEEHPEGPTYTASKYLELLERIADDLEAQKDVAYRERNMVVLLAAWLTQKLGQVVGLKDHTEPDWDPEWRTIVFFEIHNTAGVNAQLSWHIHESERPMFEFLGSYMGKWDGHTTEMKHMRILDLTKLHLYKCHVYFRDDELRLVHVGGTSVWAATKEQAEGEALTSLWDERLDEVPIVEAFLMEDEDDADAG